MKTKPFPSAVYFLAFISGIFAFAIFVGSDGPAKWAGFAALLLPTVVFYKTVLNDGQYERIWVDPGTQKYWWPTVLLAVLLGALSGYAYRQSIGMAALPAHLGTFAIMAALIGATEEIIFRGMLFYFLKKWPVFLIVLAAAASHAMYKSLLFLSPFAAGHVDINKLFLYTFLAGLLLGWLRSISKSLMPAIIAHTLWDLWVYGDSAEAPWWVW